MNDITHKIILDGQVQMNFDGPDKISQPFCEVNDVINISSELKNSVSVIKYNKRRRDGSAYKRRICSKSMNHIHIVIPNHKLNQFLSKSKQFFFNSL